MNRFQNKVVLVTGGNRNTGLYIVKKFVEEGAKVYMCGSSESSTAKGAQTLQEWGCTGVRSIPCDVSDLSQVNALFDVIEKEEAQPLLQELTAEGYAVDYVRCDISNTADRAAFFAYIKDTYGRLDVHVNNAGVAPRVRLDIPFYEPCRVAHDNSRKKNRTRFQKYSQRSIRSGTSRRNHCHDQKSCSRDIYI